MTNTNKQFAWFIIFLLLFIFIMCGCDLPTYENNSETLIVRAIQTNDEVYTLSSNPKKENAVVTPYIYIQSTNVYQIGQTVYLK